ncbi:hypothetical protein TruAng_001445 [Truncatella angustata]|nr:hypothetical protein TruAng_001445 [Truncatella angustata]
MHLTSYTNKSSKENTNIQDLARRKRHTCKAHDQRQPVTASSREVRRGLSLERMQGARPARNASSPRPRGYKYINKEFHTLFDVPEKCCSLWDVERYNCFRHPINPPKEYYQKELEAAHLYLARAYKVDLFVHRKRCQREDKALHAERRRELGLQSLPEAWDFPNYRPQTRGEKKALLGKLCVFHWLSYDAWYIFHDKGCFVCRAALAREQQEERHKRIYEDYRAKHAAALRDVNERMGWELFSCPPPPEEPMIEYGPSGRVVLRVTDWAENGRGLPGNVIGKARARANKADKKKRQVWARMSGEVGGILSSPCASGSSLGTIVQEEWEEEEEETND